MDMEHLWPQLDMAPKCDFCHLIALDAQKTQCPALGLDLPDLPGHRIFISNVKTCGGK